VQSADVLRGVALLRPPRSVERTDLWSPSPENGNISNVSQQRGIDPLRSGCRNGSKCEEYLPTCNIGLASGAGGFVVNDAGAIEKWRAIQNKTSNSCIVEISI